MLRGQSPQLRPGLPELRLVLAERGLATGAGASRAELNLAEVALPPRTASPMPAGL